jgi:hypothetical protein
MHGDVLCQVFVAARQGHDHADTGAVQVGADAPITLHVHHGEAAYGNVLADTRHQLLAALFDGLVAARLIGQPGQAIHIFHAFLQDPCGDLLGKSAEIVALGDEIGLAVNLNHGDRMPVRRGLDDNATLGGGAARLLGRLGDPGLAHLLDSGFHITAGLDQCLLALHHPGTGSFPQFLDQGCRYLHNVLLLRIRLCVAVTRWGGLIFHTRVICRRGLHILHRRLLGGRGFTLCRRLFYRHFLGGGLGGFFACGRRCRTARLFIQFDEFVRAHV